MSHFPECNVIWRKYENSCSVRQFIFNLFNSITAFARFTAWNKLLTFLLHMILERSPSIWVQLNSLTTRRWWLREGWCLIFWRETRFLFWYWGPSFIFSSHFLHTSSYNSFIFRLIFHINLHNSFRFPRFSIIILHFLTCFLSFLSPTPPP